MIDTVFNYLDVLYHPCKIWGDRTTCAGCRCENVVFVCLPAGLREAQGAGIKFLHRPKIRFFAPRVAPIHVQLGKTDGHVGPLGCAKFGDADNAGMENGGP